MKSVMEEDSKMTNLETSKRDKVLNDSDNKNLIRSKGLKFGVKILACANRVKSHCIHLYIILKLNVIEFKLQS